MTDFDEYEKMLVGKTLTNLFFTKQDGPHDYMPGISPAYYFSTIMEIDGYKKLRFGNDYIVDWNDEEPIIELTNKNWGLPKTIIFKNQRITGITKDEYDQLTIHLENMTTIAHTIDYGDKLFIENGNSNLEKEQENGVQNTAPTNTPHIAKLTWWQKLFGIR